MVDTTTLTSLITTFRAETSKDSINPERLGSLLQKIADLLATAASISDIGEPTELATRLHKIGQVLSKLSIGTNDAKNVKLSYNTVSIESGITATFPDAISIPSANTKRAGVMTADHVRQLNELANDLTTLSQALTTEKNALDNSLSNFGQRLANETTERTKADTDQSNRLSALETAISKVNTTIDNLQRTVKSNVSDLDALRSDTEDATRSIVDLKQRTEKLQKKQTTTENDLEMLTKNDYTHIETVARAGKLTVPGATALVARGLVPLIFRRIISQSRKSKDANGRRKYMDKKHGWHVHYGKDKIKFGEKDVVLIRDNRKNTPTEDQYFTDAATLFHFPKKNVVGYGKRSYDLTSGHRFLFAIAFAKDPDLRRNFDFSCLRTNLATFRVFALTKKDRDGNDVDEFHFSI